MRNALAVALALSLSAPLAAASRRRVVSVPGGDDLRIVFVGGEVLDVGEVVKGKVTRTIGVRIERRSNNRGTAALRVWMESPDGRSALRVDGIPLSGIPRLVDPQAPLGATVMHRIQIDVPAGVPAGVVVMNGIRWEATTGD